jgi:hypothetical protein
MMGTITCSIASLVHSLCSCLALVRAHVSSCLCMPTLHRKHQLDMHLKLLMQQQLWQDTCLATKPPKGVHQALAIQPPPAHLFYQQL